MAGRIGEEKSGRENGGRKGNMWESGKGRERKMQEKNEEREAEREKKNRQCEDGTARPARRTKRQRRAGAVGASQGKALQHLIGPVAEWGLVPQAIR